MWGAYVIPIFTGLLAVMTLAKDWGAHQSSWRRTGVGFLIIGLMVASAYNTYQTGKRNEQRRQEDEGKITKLQAGVDTANKAQVDNTKQFLQQFSDLSGKVAKLQTEAATEALQKQAKDLQGELVATQKAMQVPKVPLQLSFEETNGVRVSTATLPRINGAIHLRFTIINDTDTAALNGDISFLICNVCSLAKEPEGLQKLSGMTDKERNITFQRILPKSRIRTLEADINVPGPGIYKFGIEYRCVNCEKEILTNGLPPDSCMISAIVQD